MRDLKILPKNKTEIKEYDPYSFLVGGIAEKLVEQLFLSLDYKVFPFGMENTVPEIKGLLNKNKSVVSCQIRTMPDFVVKKEGEDPVFVEVKYRESGRFTYGDLVKKFTEYPYKNVLVIVVSPGHIKAEFSENLKEYPITPDSKNWLGKVKQMNFTREEKDKIVDFCKYAIHFFDGVKDVK